MGRRSQDAGWHRNRALANLVLLHFIDERLAHRSLVVFAAWSSFAHGEVMAFMAFRDASERGHLVGVAILLVIGVPLLILTPAKPPVERLPSPVA
ncbi:MAG TPA: DUF6632 domain-containing protein [Terriglobales bacterium]|nr:DUF6632 domain-containing protein [Terriglobales bacterium]